MSWEKKHVDNDLLGSYNRKYGTTEYWDSQKLMYNHKDILQAYDLLVSNIHQPRNVLSIGINNGLEIEVLKRLTQKKWDWETIMITGIDLSKSSLSEAGKRFQEININNRLFNVDLADADLGIESYDLCLAVTSLQSASIYGKLFNDFLDKIVKCLKAKSAFFIITPNCYMSEGSIVSGGVFSVRMEKQDPLFAVKFNSDCREILEKCNFQFVQSGSDFILLLALRK